jgi:hypothetical protein
MSPQERGRRGGLTTAARHGRKHMAAIGARGFAAYAARHHGGNRAAARRVLRLDGTRRDYRQDDVWGALWLIEREAANGRDE